VAPNGPGLNPVCKRVFKSACVSGVEIAGNTESAAIVSLDNKQHHATMTSGNHVDQLVEVFCAARCHRIGKLRQSECPDEMHILDLDIGALARTLIEQKINA